MNEDLESIRKRLASESVESVREDLQRLVLQRRSEHGGHAQWAALCEQAGLLSLAFNEYQLALRDNRDDPVAAFHLAQHYRERGDVTRALSLLERLLNAEPVNESYLSLYIEILLDEGAQPRAEEVLTRAVQAGLASGSAEQLRRLLRPVAKAADEMAARSDTEISTLVPTDADCIRFHTLFSGREGVYARQWVKQGGEGGYSPIHEPLTPAVIRNHLLGTYTLGVYPVRLDGTATFFALDLDIDKSALQRASGDHAFAQSLRDTLRLEGPRLLGVLSELGFSALFENSGYKGRHFWVFLEQPETAAVLHLLGRLLLSWQAPLLPPHLHLEFFPKQARLTGKGLGNLIKLPLGIHRRTGRRSVILDDRGEAVADAFALLRAVSRSPQSEVYTAIDRLKGLVVICVERDGTMDDDREDTESPTPAVGPPVTVPPRAPVWTEADFEMDAGVRHMLCECMVLAELKRLVDQHRQLGHEEQLVLIHSLGHVEAGPQAVNYLFGKCVDIGPEKFMKSRLKGNPVSCPSIRKKIPHITRRVACNCPFEFSKDRYPSPTLHLLTLPAIQPTPTALRAEPALVGIGQRFAVLDCRRREIEQEWTDLRASFLKALRAQPEQQVACPGGCYRLLQREGVEELVWEADSADTLGVQTRLEAP
jgi:hypothetical protein